MQQTGVTDRDVRHALPDLGDPTSGLVTTHERQVDTGALLHGVELTIPQVDIGAAEAGAADPDDHVVGGGDGRVRDGPDAEILAVPGE